MIEDTQLIIPPEHLTEEVIRGIIEAYIAREGTDYGEKELSLAEKVTRLLPQVLVGDIVITYDEESGSVNLLPKQDVGEPE